MLNYVSEYHEDTRTIEFDLSGLHDEHTIKAGVPPPLSELCIRELARNFASRPTLRGIANRYINRMTELLPTDLPLEVTGPLIDDEGYWKRCSVARWDNCQITDHGSSWKRAPSPSRLPVRIHSSARALARRGSASPPLSACPSPDAHRLAPLLRRLLL